MWRLTSSATELECTKCHEVARFVWFLKIGSTEVPLYMCTVCFIDATSRFEPVNIRVETL